MTSKAEQMAEGEALVAAAHAARRRKKDPTDAGIPPSRANRRAAAFLPTEAAVQRAIVEALRYLGMEVLETGHWRKQARCPHCGQYFTPAGSYGNTTGCPDIFFFDPKQPRHGWRALEVKAPGGRSLLGAIQPGRVRPEQQRLAAAGMTTIVHSWDEVLQLLGEESDE